MIHQNVNGSNFFNRSWAEFKVGFNDTRGNYWLGNDLLHQLTKEARYKLTCLVRARSNGALYEAKYGIFLVGNEDENYKLRVAHYSGNAGDSLVYHNGMAFSTYDRDNDLNSRLSCAQRDAGGFWYNSCYRAGVNVMKGLDGDFSWYGLSTPVGKELNSASMWLTC